MLGVAPAYLTDLLEDQNLNPGPKARQQAMKDLIVFVLHVLGIVYVITQSSIMSPVRRVLRRLLGEAAAPFYCAACTGFWVGFALHFAHMDAGMQLLQASFAACALGALWSEYGSTLSPWQAEAHDKTEKATHG